MLQGNDFAFMYYSLFEFTNQDLVQLLQDDKYFLLGTVSYLLLSMMARSLFFMLAPTVIVTSVATEYLRSAYEQQDSVTDPHEEQLELKEPRYIRQLYDSPTDQNDEQIEFGEPKYNVQFYDDFLENRGRLADDTDEDLPDFEKRYAKPWSWRRKKKIVKACSSKLCSELV